MNLTILLVVAGLSALHAILTESRIRENLRFYWKRPCLGTRWRRRFSGVSKTAIREFLEIFVDEFGFSRNKRCCFSPDDKIMDIYRAIYPPGNPLLADCLELESFQEELQWSYKKEFHRYLNDTKTLGEIFEFAVRHESNLCD